MPTIVTEIVNNMFRSQRNKRAFAQKLREMPVESESETEDSDAESLDRSLDASRDYIELAANQPREEYFLWGTELSRYGSLSDFSRRFMEILLRLLKLGFDAYFCILLSSGPRTCSC